MTITKRELLRPAAAGGGALMLGARGATAQTSDPVRVVDAHTHWYPAEWVELVKAEGPAHGARIGSNERGAVTFAVPGLTAEFRPNYVDLASRIAAMDADGIAVQVLSLMAPMVYWAPAAFALKLSHAFNDAAATAHRAYPDRFVALAMVPMHEPTLALEELQRAAKLPGLRGVMMATAINGKNLDEKQFFPVYAKLEELGWPMFTHPIGALGGDRMARYYLRNLLGNPIEIGVAGYSLILGGVLDTFPKLEVMLPRAGGNVPWGIGRLDRTVERMPELAKANRPATQYLRRFYYDSIIESPEILTSLIQLVGADRVLFGTDYASPMRDKNPTAFIRNLAQVSPADRNLILGGNAARLFRL